MLSPIIVPRGTGGNKTNVPLASSRWETPDHIVAALYLPGDILLGAAPQGAFIGTRDDRHFLTIAGSRAGKGTSVIVPNLCLYPGSCFVIDPKGENAILTANRRGFGSKWCDGIGQDCHVLDPFNIVPNKPFIPARFNPMRDLDPDSRYGVDDAALLAEALLIQDGGDSHWTNAARNLLRGLILFVAAREPPDLKTLCRVRDLLTLPQKQEKSVSSTNSGDILSIEGLFSRMRETQDRYGVIARTANIMASKSEAELSGVLSTAQEQTSFLDGGPMREVLSGSDFQMEDLKSARGLSVYLCLPAMRIETHYRWLRLLLNAALAAMERTPGKPEFPVWFMLDEFAALGHMPSLEKAAGLVAGYGVRLHPVIQDLTQLKTLYRDRWETFLGNAGVLQFFGNTDLFTCEHISKRLGHTEYVAASQSDTANPGDKLSTGQQFSRQTTPLLRPEEVGIYFSRESKTQIIFDAARLLPMALRRIEYYDPQHKSTFRRLYDWHETLGVRPPP